MAKDLEGAKAPDFVLPGSDGKSHSLKDHKGRVIVLYFYPKDETPGCTKEACGFRDAFAEIRKLGAVILGVSKDSFVSHGKFIANHQLPFVLLSDMNTETMQKYGAWGEKKLYGKTVQGTIRSTVVIGTDGKIVKHWPVVRKAEQHLQDVLDFLKQFAAEKRRKKRKK